MHVAINLSDFDDGNGMFYLMVDSTNMINLKEEAASLCIKGRLKMCWQELKTVIGQVKFKDALT